ncbi:MAG: N-acetylmuramoyl-L-alanine amidase [Planctomycetota bacterium]|nr:MAG: N-acetylmuramoyl-L-alanine amidase [Planctomycetota bacterium]
MSPARFRLPAGLLLAPAALLGLVACAAPPPARPRPVVLEAPVPSPPGDLDLEARIDWWEDLLPRLIDADRDEALLRLGQLHLDARHPAEARQYFRQAQLGWLSAREQAQAEYGIGLSYLLERRPEAAQPHLLVAREGLAGPEAEECEVLLEVGRGRTPTGDPALLARLEPFLPEAPLVVARPAEAPAPLAGVVDVSRRQWHARPLRGNHDPMTRPWRITVHHSAEPLHSDSLAAAKAEVRRIQQYHQDGHGWADLGYHFLIDRSGRVFEGRPLTAQGAHAGGSNNVGNIGICLLGNYAADPDRGGEYLVVQRPTEAQLQALRELLESLRAHYGIARSEVHGHLEYRDTACPGPILEDWVRRYRSGS